MTRPLLSGRGHEPGWTGEGEGEGELRGATGTRKERGESEREGEHRITDKKTHKRASDKKGEGNKRK